MDNKTIKYNLSYAQIGGECKPEYRKNVYFLFWVDA